MFLAAIKREASEVTGTGVEVGVVYFSLGRYLGFSEFLR